MDALVLQPLSFLAEAAVPYVDHVEHPQGLCVASTTPELQTHNAYSRLLVYCIVVANSAIARQNIHAAWQALKELHRAAHGDRSLPESVWHTWQCTFKTAEVCDLAHFPCNLMYDCGLSGTVVGLPTNDALLDVEQLACAQQAYFAQVGTTHVRSCKPQSSHEVQEAQILIRNVI